MSDISETLSTTTTTPRFSVESSRLSNLRFPTLSGVGRIMLADSLVDLFYFYFFPKTSVNVCERAGQSKTSDQVTCVKRSTVRSDDVIGVGVGCLYCV